MKYKYLLWDIDGTILDFLAAERAAMQFLFLKYGFGECDEKKLSKYSAINVKYWQALERGELTRSEILVGRFREFFEEEGFDVSLAEAFNQDYQITLGDTVVFCDDSYELLKKLKSEGYILYAITNGTKTAQDRKLRKSGFIDIFEKVFISEVVGIEKPGREFFDAVMADGRIEDKGLALVIGDSLTSDILGGNNAGIDTCWYNPFGSENTTGAIVKYEISNLWDVEKILCEKS